MTAAVALVLVGLGIREGWWENLEAVIASPEAIRQNVEDLGAWGPLAFVAAQMLQVVLVPVPGAVFPPAGALAFGPWPAMLLSLTGLAMGSAIVFSITRRWGRPVAHRMVGEERIARYESLIESHGNVFLWLIFLLPLLPDDAVCAIAGLSKITFRRFLFISTVGRMPSVVAGVFTMAGLERSPLWMWAVAAGAFGGLTWLGVRMTPAIEQRWAHWARRTDVARRGWRPQQTKTMAGMAAVGLLGLAVLGVAAGGGAELLWSATLAVLVLAVLAA